MPVKKEKIQRHLDSLTAKHHITKDDPEHPDYIDPYLRDGENQNYN